jgi:hypothetical protein
LPKKTGAAFSVVIAVPVESFTVSGDTFSSFETTGQDSGKPVYRHFCRNCGAPLFSKIDIDPSSVYIKAGTLDDTSWLDPKYHLWISSAQPWVHIDESAFISERG